MREEVKYVSIQQLRCWRCRLLKKNIPKGIHNCPQNVFRNGELFPEFFALKCGKFEPEKGVTAK